MAGAMAGEDTGGRRVRLASTTTSVVLGVLGLALVVAHVLMSHAAHGVKGGTGGIGDLVPMLVLYVPAFVIARRQPANPIAWILIGIGVGLAFYGDVEVYSVLDYHVHHGNLPLGPVAVLIASNLWSGLFLGLPLVVLLFPDGRLSGRWWTVLWAYLATCALLVACLCGTTAWDMYGQPILVDHTGHLLTNASPQACSERS